MNESLVEQQLSCCCCLENWPSAKLRKANSPTLLTIYRKESETVSGVSGSARDGDDYARPVCSNCCSDSDARNRCFRGSAEGAGEGCGPAGEPSRSAGDARVRRPGADVFADRRSHVTGEAAPRG